MNKRAARRVLVVVFVTWIAVGVLIGAVMALDYGAAAFPIVVGIGIIAALPFGIAALVIRPPKAPAPLEGAVPAPAGDIMLGVYLQAATTLQTWPTARFVVDRSGAVATVRVVRDDGEVLFDAPVTDVTTRMTSRGVKVARPGGFVRLSAVSNSEVILPNAIDKNRELHRRIDAAVQGYVIPGV